MVVVSAGAESWILRLSGESRIEPLRINVLAVERRRVLSSHHGHEDHDHRDSEVRPTICQRRAVDSRVR